MEVRTITHGRSHKPNACERFDSKPGKGRPRDTIRDRGMHRVENEKATRQLGQPFLSRENSSNGDAKTVKTFWRNLMSRKRAVSRNISEINLFIFCSLRNRLIAPLECL